VIVSRRRSVPLSSGPGFGKARRGPIRRGPTACDVDVPFAISRDQIHSIHYPAHLRLPPGDGQSEVLSQIGIGALVSLRTGCVNAYRRQASATYWHAVAYRSGHFRGNPSEGWRHSYQRDVMAPEPVSLRRLCSDRPDRGCTGGSKARPGRTKVPGGPSFADGTGRRRCRAGEILAPVIGLIYCPETHRNGCPKCRCTYKHR
jgi:hypothetical protein